MRTRSPLLPTGIPVISARPCAILGAPMALLSLRDVRLRFAGVVALDNVSLDVEEHRIVGLIGPNGAGKTTAFNVITRLYTPDEGDVLLDGHRSCARRRTGSSGAASPERSRTSRSSRR